MEHKITLGLLALILGALGAFIVSRFGGRLGLIDKPTVRSSHSSATPKGGGIGIAAAFLVTAVLLNGPSLFWLPLGAMAAVSFRVDQREIPPKPRLMIHLILMGILVMGTGGGHYQNINKIIAALFWIVFITGTANFYNFMDGINGIAGIGGTVGFGLLAFETFHDQPGIGLLASGMAFACLGFLPFNLPRARVFMGDIGSIVLGGVFGGLVYLASRTILDFLCLTSFLFPFYVDELTTMIVRLRQSENLTKPHRRHLYQLLANERQIPHWRIATGYGFFQLLVGVSVLITKRYGVAAVIAVLISWFFLFVLGSYYIRRLPSCENGPGQRGEGMPFYGP